MKYFLLGLNKYAVFSGRANRKEYWYFLLFSVIINLLALLVPYLPILLLLLLLCPTLAVTSRRLHDVGFSGWLSIFILFPFGWFILAFVLARKGDIGPNKYGSIYLI